MSSSLPSLRPDFADVAPKPTDEIEAKYNVRSLNDLRRLRDALIGYDLHSREFWFNNPEIYYRRKSGHAGVLFTRPVSWYMDDKNLSLMGTHANLRVRLTRGTDDYFEWGVKGKARGFDGLGSVIRHEHEVTTDTLTIPSDEFMRDQVTRELLLPVINQPLYYHFASDVSRNVVGVPTRVNGKNALFEVCFDPIRYIKPSSDDIKIGRDVTTMQGTEFHRLNQVEIEYYHPDHTNPDMQHFARSLGLDRLSKAEVEQALHQVCDSVQEVASRAGVKMTPTTISKARTGLDALHDPDMDRPAMPGILSPAILIG